MTMALRISLRRTLDRSPLISSMNQKIKAMNMKLNFSLILSKLISKSKLQRYKHQRLKLLLWKQPIQFNLYLSENPTSLNSGKNPSVWKQNRQHKQKLVLNQNRAVRKFLVDSISLNWQQPTQRIQLLNEKVSIP